MEVVASIGCAVAFQSVALSHFNPLKLSSLFRPGGPCWRRVLSRGVRRHGGRHGRRHAGARAGGGGRIRRRALLQPHEHRPQSQFVDAQRADQAGRRVDRGGARFAGTPGRAGIGPPAFSLFGLGCKRCLGALGEGLVCPALSRQMGGGLGDERVGGGWKVVGEWLRWRLKDG